MGGRGCLGAWGDVPTHVHMYKCTCIHVQKLQMAADMEASMFIMFNMHVCACVHACVHVCACMHVHVCTCVHAWDTPHTPILMPTPSTHLPPPQGGTPGINQNSIELELIR